jgi:hypothetical protein
LLLRILDNVALAAYCSAAVPFEYPTRSVKRKLATSARLVGCRSVSVTENSPMEVSRLRFRCAGK